MFLISVCWQEVNDKLKILKKELDGGDFGALAKIHSTVIDLVEPPELVRPFVHPAYRFSSFRYLTFCSYLWKTNSM